MSEKEKGHKGNGNYLKFCAMIATSMVAMFLFMYLNSAQILDHAWFSETRFMMAILMGGTMAVIMLLFMLGMYKNAKLNALIFVIAILMFGGGLSLVRSQVTVDDSDYMEGMIPHHSIAVLTSERARIRDPRVRKLADDIIKAQRREIKEMEWLIKDITENGIAKTASEAEARPVPGFKPTPE